MKHGLMKLACIAAASTLMASGTALAQSHGGNASGGVGPSTNGGSGSNGYGTNDAYSPYSNAPADSGSRATNSSPSTINGDAGSDQNTMQTNPYNSNSDY